MWRMVFEPGTLKAIGRTGGKQILTSEVKTAGKPAKIVLAADRKAINADGRDLSFITVKILDKEGLAVPYADNLVRFSISGTGKIAGVDNGLQTSTESFQADQRKAFHGLCLVVVQSDEQPGQITLQAESDNLESASIIIESK